MGETNLGDKGLIALVECLGNISVCSWSLNGNDIHATGVSYLADGVSTGKMCYMINFLLMTILLDLKELQKLVNSL